MARKWLFSNGSQFADWRDFECGDCKFYVPDSEIGFGCPIEEQVSLAYFLGNEVKVPDELNEVGKGSYHPYKCTKKVKWTTCQ